MVEKKYETELLILGLVIGSIILGFGVGFIAEPGFYRIIPINSAGIEMVIIIMLIIVSTIVSSLIIGYILGPLLLWIHKQVLGRRMVYVIQEKPEPEIIKMTFKSFFPALLAVHLALLFGINKNIIEAVVVDPDGIFAPLLTVLILVIVSSFLSFALFSPIWFLIDSGIIYSNKESVKSKRDPIEVRSVGSWYMNQLKGYAAIAAIVSYITFFIEMIIYFGPDIDITAPLGLLLFPFILAVLGLPAVLILEVTVNHRKRFIIKFAEKIGITKRIGDPLKEL
jgi:hypothetical protein